MQNKTSFDANKRDTLDRFCRQGAPRKRKGPTQRNQRVSRFRIYKSNSNMRYSYGYLKDKEKKKI